MRKFIFQLLIVILLLIGLISDGFVNRANTAPKCSIVNLTTSVNNRKLSYSQVGNGRPILLLHGLFASKEQWHSLMCRLSARGYRSIAPDLPGYGNSQNYPVQDYALENQVARLHEWMQKLGIRSFDVAGSSMGGAIAQLYAQQYPTEVRSVAFIGAPLGIADWAPSVKAAILQGINPFIPITKEQFQLEMRLLFFNPPKIPDSVIEEKVSDYKTRNRNYQKVWNIVNLYDDILCQRRPTRLPTLILWGKEDKIYDFRAAKRLQACIVGSQLIQFPKTGHLPMMESTMEVDVRYAEFLKTRGR